MIHTTALLLERHLNIRYERSVVLLHRAVVAGAAGTFILLSTVFVAFDSIFPDQAGIDSLQVGNIMQQDVFAPAAVSYVSEVLTEQRRQAARDSVRPIFGAPNASVVRQRTTLASQIITYIDNIRRDTFATNEQRIRDISAIRELQLDEAIITRILDMDAETWRDVSEQIVTVLERVMSDQIRETDLDDVRAQLPIQVVRFDEQDAAVIVAIVGELIQPNISLNEAATREAVDAAVAAVGDVRRAFERGQLVISGGTQIKPEDYEALEQLGLLRLSENRLQEIGRAFVGSVIAMVIIGLYIIRFRPQLIYREPRFLALLAAIFLIVLAGARVGMNGQIYIYPTAALALICVTIIGPEIAIIAVLGLAMLVGMMVNNSLEIAVLVGAGGLMGALSLKRAERLNSFFFAGLMVAVINMGVAALFNLGTPSAANTTQFALLMLYSLLNGILTAAAAVAGLYILTLTFNLPSALKLVELSQPNQPLLQRLLREAPGTYQHTLQVANLSEQAANAIGANAELTRVAALYHDIGKMLNPAFFSENQRDIGNPHDALNDPYRSADIIISHVTGGDDMARQYRLPNRIRDFIREHHGTSQVYVFYRQAVILAGDDESAVNIDDFTYPGPKPQSRETAILMLADSCESTIRSRQPKTKSEIEEIVAQVIDSRRKSGQLDESGLRLDDLKAIQSIFIEMLQAIFHPRINYEEAIARVRGPARRDASRTLPAQLATDEKKKTITTPSVTRTGITPRLEVSGALDDDDDTPLAEVPRLRRKETGEVKTHTNGGPQRDNQVETPPASDEIPADQNQVED